jgi:molybdopterin converting factor subunit 1
MKVNVLLFGHYSDYIQNQPLEFDLPVGACVQDLTRKLAEREPRLADLKRFCRFAVNEEYAELDTKLTEDCTVAVLPPMSGG